MEDEHNMLRITRRSHERQELNSLSVNSVWFFFFHFSSQWGMNCISSNHFITTSIRGERVNICRYLFPQVSSVFKYINSWSCQESLWLVVMMSSSYTGVFALIFWYQFQLKGVLFHGFKMWNGPSIIVEIWKSHFWVTLVALILP